VRQVEKRRCECKAGKYIQKKERRVMRCKPRICEKHVPFQNNKRDCANTENTTHNEVNWTRFAKGFRSPWSWFWYTLLGLDQQKEKCVNNDTNENKHIKWE
jgi:hypothetical protein